MIRIGRILTTHGVKGELKVMPLTDDPKRYEKLDYVFLELLPEYKKIHIENVKYHKNALLLKFKEIESMTAAEELHNIYLCITKEQLAPLPQDHYYIFELIGLEVYENHTFLGEIKDVFQTGSNDVYVVQNEEKEILIPALKSVVKKIDLEAKKMFVELPLGLLE